MYVDSMKLAYAAFQSCRYFDPNPEALQEARSFLEGLIPAFIESRKSGRWIVEAPWVDKDLPNSFYWLSDAPDEEGDERTALSEGTAEMLDLCLAAAEDLKELCARNRAEAVRALGYAVHVVPELASSGRELEARYFQFNFRIAAGHWAEYSEGLQKALARAAGIESTRVEKLLTQEGFVVDWS